MKKISKKIKGLFDFVKIDYSFLFLLILWCLLDMTKIYFIYIVFIILHECSHLCIAKKLGYFPKRLKLTIFGASLEGFDDFLVLDEIKIVLAGPLFNLLVVVLCYLSFWFYPESFEYLNDVLFVNQMILLFNVLPIFPLDFGRLILCLFSLKDGRRNAVKKVKCLSYFFLVVMFFVSVIIFFVYYNLSLGLASVNLCVLLFESATGTSFKREIVLRKKMNRLNNGITQKVIYIKDGYTEKYLLKFLDGEHYYIFIFVDSEFNEIRRMGEFELMKKLGFI